MIMLGTGSWLIYTLHPLPKCKQPWCFWQIKKTKIELCAILPFFFGTVRQRLGFSSDLHTVFVSAPFSCRLSGGGGNVVATETRASASTITCSQLNLGWCLPLFLTRKSAGRRLVNGLVFHSVNERVAKWTRRCSDLRCQATHLTQGLDSIVPLINRRACRALKMQLFLCVLKLFQ